MFNFKIPMSFDLTSQNRKMLALTYFCMLAIVWVFFENTLKKQKALN